jgi:uncharacterized iron-regulated membrane protein
MTTVVEGDEARSGEAEIDEAGETERAGARATLVRALEPRPKSRVRRRLHTTATGRRKAFVVVHRWASLLLALWVVLEALTGSLITFSPEISRLVDRGVFSASGDAEISWEEAADAGTAEYERGRLALVVPPGEDLSGDVWWVGVYDDDGEYHAVLVDPATGEVTDADHESPGWLRLAERLHFDLNMTSVFGLDGTEAIGLLGVVWLLIIVTGMYVWWWPGVKRWANAWRVRRGRGPFTFSLDLHKAVGITILVPLLLVVLTGITFGWPEQSRWIWNAVTFGSYEEPDVTVPLSTAQPGAEPIGLDAAVAVVEELGGDVHVEQVSPPQGNPVGVYDVHAVVDGSFFAEAGGERVVDIAVDQYSGAVVAVDDPAAEPVVDQAFDRWIVPVHFGTWAGLASKVAWVVLGVAATVMAATGVVMYVVRLRRRRTRAAEAVR